MCILHSTAFGLILLLKIPRIMLCCAQNPLSHGPEVIGIVQITCAKITNEGRMSS